MSRNYGLGSKPDKIRISDRAYIPIAVLTICALIIGASYLWG
jgi:hypothetical protein